MDFHETVQYLERLQENRMRLDLEPSQKLLDLLGRPDRKQKTIIVAGTNGKGSVCGFLTSIFRAAGIGCGTYTSPHLETVLERVALDGDWIDPTTFARLATQLRDKIEAARFPSVSYFEFLSMLAVLAFQEARTDISIFEVGLGGRLDTTNALERLGVVITTIGFDHMRILGNTLTKIASEKGAILRKDRFAIISKQPTEALVRLQQISAETGAQSFYYGKDFSDYEGPIGLLGEHQKANAATAAFTARHLSSFGIKISEEAISQGIQTTCIPGRLEHWKDTDGKEVWLDVAHNRDSIDALVRFFRKNALSPIDIVVGMLRDKEYEYALSQLESISSHLHLCKPNSPRAWDLADSPPTEVLELALQDNPRVLCTGSFYVTGEIRTWLRNHRFELLR